MNREIDTRLVAVLIGFVVLLLIGWGWRFFATPDLHADPKNQPTLGSNPARTVAA